MTSQGAPPPSDGSDELVVRFGSAALPGYAAVLRTAVNELASADFRVRLDEAGSEPVDYLAGIEIEIGGERAWRGTVLDALPRDAEVHVDCASGVSLDEAQMGVMAAEQIPAVDLVYAAARSAGFSAENTSIEGLDKLPVEPIEVVVALRGVQVPGRRALGAVSLLPPKLGQVALEAFDLDRAPEGLVEAFQQADCFAVVVGTASRLWDAERSALADVDVALGWLAVRARYGLARLPGGGPQRYERDNTRALARRGGAMAVKGLSSGRRWIRDPATLTARPTLLLGDAGGQLWPDLPTRIARHLIDSRL